MPPSKYKVKSASTKSHRNIVYTVKSIEVLESAITIPEGFSVENDGSLKYGFSVKLDTDQDSKAIKIIIYYSFSAKQTLLFDLKVQCSYSLKEINPSIKGLEDSFKRFLVHLVELSVNHARGIQSVLLKGTVIEHFYIPIVTSEKLLSDIAKFEAEQ